MGLNFTHHSIVPQTLVNLKRFEIFCIDPDSNATCFAILYQNSCCIPQQVRFGNQLICVASSDLSNFVSLFQAIWIIFLNKCSMLGSTFLDYFSDIIECYSASTTFKSTNDEYLIAASFFEATGRTRL